MGTNGIYGFYYKGKYYIYYRHFDSYLSGLGNEILRELKDQLKKDPSLKCWKKLIKKLENEEFSYARLKEKVLHYDIQKKETLDELLKYCYINNFTNEEGEPYYKEYGYIINLDDKVLEIYKGDMKCIVFEFDDLPNKFSNKNDNF